MGTLVLNWKKNKYSYPPIAVKVPGALGEVGADASGSLVHHWMDQ